MENKLLITNERATIFGDLKKEWLNLTAPLLIIPLILISILSNVNIQEPANKSILYFLASIIGDGHILFTYIFLIKSKRGNLIFKSIFLKNKMRLIILLIFSIGVFVYFLLSHFENSHLVIMEYALLLIWGQHALGQIKGMSLIYNKKMLLRRYLEPYVYLKANTAFIEKLLFTIMQICWLLYLSFNFAKMDEKIYPLVILWLVSTLIVLNSIVLLRNHFYKTIFLLRVFLFPLSAHFPICGFFLFFTHGLEYELYLQDVIKENTSLSSYKYFLAIFILFPSFHYLSKINFEENIQIFLVAYAFIKAMDYAHFYLDAIIFRFRDPLVKSAYEIESA